MSSVMFDDYVLHPQSRKTLTDFLGQPSHATLLSGPAGVGTTSIATLLAAELLCDTVEHLENQQYYRLIAPVNGSIAIETVRALQSFFRLSVPGDAAVKRVVVIDAAESMSREAQNALLKLLEEPPEGTVMILTSTRPERLLTTVRSRLHVVTLMAPSNEDIARHFSKAGHPEALVARAQLLSNGSIAQMHTMLSEENAGMTAFETAKRILGAQPFGRLVEVEKLAKDKEAAREFVDALLQLAGISAERAATQNPASLPRWQSILAATNTAQDALGKSGNTKLVLTDLMLAL